MPTIGPGDAAEIVSRYESGESLFKIARSMRRRYAPVRQAFIDAGGTFRETAQWETRYSNRVRKLSRDDVSDIVRKFGSGEGTVSELAREYGVSRSTIRYHLSQQGVITT